MYLVPPGSVRVPLPVPRPSPLRQAEPGELMCSQEGGELWALGMPLRSEAGISLPFLLGVRQVCYTTGLVLRTSPEDNFTV